MTVPAHSRLNLENLLALATLVFAFATIFMGGTVNPNGASLACPEALFVCHGQWFPELKGGVLFEHGHRLVAMSLGLLRRWNAGGLRLGAMRHGKIRGAFVAAIQVVVAFGYDPPPLSQ